MASGQATRTWVSGVGDDANPCSRTAPCKTFAGAISKTAAKGEINALDPGGFGAVTITKAITIDGAGFTSGVLTNAANAINVSAGATDTVTLRNLDIDGLDTATNGIKFNSGKRLVVEDSSIYGFAASAINATPSTANASLLVDNVSIRDVTGDGVSLVAAGANFEALLRGTTITGSDANGVLVGNNTRATLDTVGLFDNNLGGVRAKPVTGQAAAFITNSSITGTGSALATGGTAVFADANSRVGLAGTTIFGNSIGTGTAGGGILEGFCGNTITGNFDDGPPPTGTCPDTPETQTVTVATPAPPPTTVTTPAPPPTVAPVLCVVPELVGLTKTAATRGLTAASCKLGVVTTKKTRRSYQVGHVVSQKTRGGTKLGNGAKVAVTVGKR
jgi:hypothetical protein